MKLSIYIYICTVFCRIYKNAQVCIYSLADLNIDHFVEFTFLDNQSYSHVNNLPAFEIHVILNWSIDCHKAIKMQLE